jgi:hypothetical protein
VLQDVPGTLAVDIRNRTGYLDIGSFQHLLEPVQFTAAFPDKALAVSDEFPQLTLVFAWDITCPEQTVRKENGNPFRILYIRLPAGRCLHMASIYHNRIPVRRYKDVV